MLKRVAPLLFLSLFIPLISFAAWIPGQPLVPECPTKTVGEEVLQCSCGFGEFSQLIQNGINLAIYIGVFIMVFTIVYAGFLLVTNPTNAGNREKAKKIIPPVLWGFAVLLGSFLLVDTFFNALAKNPEWNNILDSNAATLCPGEVNVGGDILTVKDTSGINPITSSQSANMTAFTTAGIPVSSSGNCTNKFSASCTSLDGMQQQVIDQIIHIKNQCKVFADTYSPPRDCGVTVTGGTETGHEITGTHTHEDGYKIDLRPTETLNLFLEKNLTRAETDRTGAGGGPTYHDSCGNEYVRELATEKTPEHWDITVTEYCGSVGGRF